MEDDAGEFRGGAEAREQVSLQILYPAFGPAHPPP